MESLRRSRHCAVILLSMSIGRTKEDSPLYVACQAGHVGVVKYLLSLEGIDPNKPANGGTTPFFVTCQKGHKEVVSLLLADPSVDPN